MPSQSEIRQQITNKIIESLKQGRIPWRKPWSGIQGPRIPTNFITKRRYSGINIPILWGTSQERGYDLDYYASFNQWKSLGASVRKGEKATQVVFFKTFSKTVEDESGNEKEEKIPLLRVFPVFNIAQVSGPKIDELLGTAADSPFTHVHLDEFQKMVEATGADVRFGGSRAVYYRFPEDYIQVPFEERFESFPAFAETLAHELAHWSEFRLGWTGNYAEGELRAEMSAVFTMAHLGIADSGDLTNHVAYLGSWLKALEDDPKYIFRAAAAASKATDYLLSFSNAAEEQVEPEEAVAG